MGFFSIHLVSKQGLFSPFYDRKTPEVSLRRFQCFLTITLMAYLSHFRLPKSDTRLPIHFECSLCRQESISDEVFLYGF